MNISIILILVNICLSISIYLLVSLSTCFVLFLNMSVYKLLISTYFPSMLIKKIRRDGLRIWKILKEIQFSSGHGV